MSVASEILKQAVSSAGNVQAEYIIRAGNYIRSGADFFTPHPEEMLSGGIILKDSRSVVSGLDAQQRFFIKKYKKNGFWRTFKRALQYPRSWKCLATALRLREIGIATPAVLFASRYCLVTEVLNPAQTVYLPVRPELAWDAVPLMARLHAAGIRHGDLNLRNICCLADGSLGLIDLDGSRLYRGAVPDKVRFLELARLTSSYLKCVHPEPGEMERITRKFAESYRTCTGQDFYSAALLARVIELTGRR